MTSCHRELDTLKLELMCYNILSYLLPSLSQRPTPYLLIKFNHLTPCLTPRPRAKVKTTLGTHG